MGFPSTDHWPWHVDDMVDPHSEFLHEISFSMVYMVIYRRISHSIIYIYIYTLWLFNIAMENGPFIVDFPIKTSI